MNFGSTLILRFYKYTIYVHQRDFVTFCFRFYSGIDIGCEQAEFALTNTDTSDASWHELVYSYGHDLQRGNEILKAWRAYLVKTQQE